VVFENVDECRGNRKIEGDGHVCEFGVVKIEDDENAGRGIEDEECCWI